MLFKLSDWLPVETQKPLSPPLSSRHFLPTLKFSHPLPYGAILEEEGVQFLVFSRHATEMYLLLYDSVDDPDPSQILSFDPELNRWGDMWSMFVPGLRAGQLYHFLADGPFDPSRGLRFNKKCRLIDPFCKALAGKFQTSTVDDGITRPPKCVVIDDWFDWKGDRHLCRDMCDTVIYEMHVKGFTRSESSHCKYPGTYKGVVEMIPYLKTLGVTAVELMPIHEFPTNLPNGTTPALMNYWGYDTMAFFAPHRGYAYDQSPGGQVREFKEMVLSLHQSGIEVILDVVFNHTSEGNDRGPTFSFKGLENPVYYMLENDRQYYRNYSGCGNTFNGNHPISRELLFNCLRYWVHNYHIDGFRFDLASILSRDQNGILRENTPILEMISEDPLLADTKIIAEAWDAAGVYQVGHFQEGSTRWAEWNGRYRDDVRRYWRGDPHMTSALASRISGSSDLYQHSGRMPYHSINFITSHDGFTLNDLVSYNDKHNMANGENNCDGDNNNNSYNYGCEGETLDPAIEAVRNRQIKNFFATLLLSQGVPMFVAGDEVRRTQRGNNNAYCQDNELSWFDWTRLRKNNGIFQFVQKLLRFRNSESTIRRRHFLTGQPVVPGGLPDVAWFAPNGTPFDWNNASESLSCFLSGEPQKDMLTPSGNHLLIFFHPSVSEGTFAFPTSCRNLPWRLFINTAGEPGEDIFPDNSGPEAVPSDMVKVSARSLRCYIAPQ